MKKRRLFWTFTAIISTVFFMGSAMVASAETYSISTFNVQQRIHESGESYNLVTFEFMDESYQCVTTNIVSDFKVTDPNGELMVLPALSVNDPYGYRNNSYDSDLGNWGSWGTYTIMDYFAKFTEPLVNGTYSLEITTTNGQVLTAEYQVTTSDYLPIVSSDSFEFVVDSSGNVVWTWDFPEAFYSLETFNDYNVRAFIAVYENDSIKVWYSIAGPTHMGRAFISKEIVDEINNSGGDTVSCLIQFRANSSSNRSNSNSLSSSTFPPTVTPSNGDTNPIIINSDLSFSFDGTYSSPFGEDMDLSVDFTFFDDQNGTLLWKLENVTVQ